MRAVIVSVGWLLLLLQGAGHAEEAAGAKNKRVVYVVKHGDARHLAGLLSKHFQGDAEVQTAADSPANCLLISASPSACDEAVKLLEQLDRRTRLVAIEVLIAEFTPGKDGKAGFDEKDLVGPMKDVLQRVQALKKDGVLTGLKQIQLTAVEFRPASLLIAQSRPYVTGVSARTTGFVQKVINYRDTGLMTKVTSRVIGENISLDLDVEDSRMLVPDDGIEIGKDDGGAPIRATEIVNASAKTSLIVPSGHAVLAQGVRTESRAGNAQTLIIVGARIVE